MLVIIKTIMVLINCYYYIINVDKSVISKKYTLKPTKIKINEEIVYDLIHFKICENNFFKMNLF